jgi:hypothetical protein
MSDLVECYSGYAYGERPKAFTWHEQRMAVAKVLDRKHFPGKKYFKVLTMDDQVFELIYDEQQHRWTVALP